MNTCSYCGATETVFWAKKDCCNKCYNKQKYVLRESPSKLACITCDVSKSKLWYKGPTCWSCYHKKNPRKYIKSYCEYCNQTKSCKEWYEDKTMCQTCYQRKRREKNLEVDKGPCIDCGNTKSRDWRAGPTCKSCYFKKVGKSSHYRFLHAKRTSKKRKLEFNIPFEIYEELIVKPCYYCQQTAESFGIGLDRIDNSKGYILGNVLPCCKMCNQLRNNFLTVEEAKTLITVWKNNVTAEELLKLLKYLEEIRKPSEYLMSNTTAVKSC